MPTPNVGESEKKYISRCIPMVIEEGTAKDSSQAAAICHSKWAEHKKKHEDIKDQNMLFRTDISRGIASGKTGVDRENDVIKGLAVVTLGVTHDKRGEFDDKELVKIVQLGNESQKGIKSRFGHPNMSGTALGTFLGRVKNFYQDGNIVRGDLYIDKTAHETPDGDLAKYVMDLADSDPEAFGTSMVIHWEPEYKIEKDGTACKDDDGDSVPPFIRVSELFSVDVVDDPAANNGMFGLQFFGNTNVKFSAEMTSFLDTFLQDPKAVDNVIGFLKRYSTNRDFIEKKGVCEMLDLKELTVEMLKENRSDIYEAVHKVGFDAGIAEEYKKKTDAITAGELFSKETVEKNKQEFDTSISEKVSEIEKVKSEFSKTLTEKDASIAKLTEEKDAETKKFTDKEAESKKLTAELAVEKKWSTLSESYKEEDAKEIKGILLKSEMGEALSKEETESLISKKISASSLLTSTATIIETGITDENRKNELRKLGGIKPKVK